MEEFDRICDTHLWVWTLWQALYINIFNPHNNPVGWELLLFPIQKIKMNKVFMKMMRRFGVNLRIWLDLKSKQLKGKVEWLERMENENDMQEEHY